MSADEVEPKEGARSGGGGQAGAKKRKGKSGQAGKKTNKVVEEEKVGVGGEVMAEEARKLALVAEGAAQQVEKKAQEERCKAEASLEEPMRSRVAELEMQARAGGREFFKDLVMAGVSGDKISTSWIAQYATKHGYN